MEKKRLRVVAERVRESMHSKEKSSKASERARAGGQERKERTKRERARAHARKKERETTDTERHRARVYAFASAFVWLEKRIENSSESHFRSPLSPLLAWKPIHSTY